MALLSNNSSMARLAIRATGDKSKRENVTTGDTDVRIDVVSGNAHIYTIYVHEDAYTRGVPTITMVTPDDEVVFTNED